MVDGSVAPERLSPLEALELIKKRSSCDSLVPPGEQSKENARHTGGYSVQRRAMRKPEHVLEDSNVFLPCYFKSTLKEPFNCEVGVQTENLIPSYAGSNVYHPSEALAKIQGNLQKLGKSMNSFVQTVSLIDLELEMKMFPDLTEAEINSVLVYMESKKY